VKAVGFYFAWARYQAEPLTSSLTHAPATERSYHPARISFRFP